MLQTLSDLRVCDLTQNLAGPFCCQVLGDLGAEVVKVEPPGGDPGRAWGPPFWGDDSTLFLSANRNKRSIVLDLKEEEGREALHRIAARSDVLVQSSRLGVAERLGFDYEAIRAVKEDVIHMSITAYGREGPKKKHPGYDPLVQAFSGIMSLTGHPDGPPARVGGSVVDFGTGMWAALAILAAVRERDRTGEGARLDTALLDTSLGWISYHIMGYLSTGKVPGRMGTGLGSIVPYQAFPTADGNVMIAGGNDAIFRRLCAALGVEELADDPRFGTNPDRVAHREELIPLLEERTRRHGTDALVRLMEEHSVPCSPIQDVAEVVEHPQVRASGMLDPAPHPELPDYRDAGLPLKVEGERPRGARPPPAAGEHSLEILGELGFGDEEIRRMVGEGIVEPAPDDGVAGPDDEGVPASSEPGA